MFHYHTAGESHGKQLTAIVSGVPSGVPLLAEHINQDLKRRQGGYGRGGRMKIESDEVEITSGVRDGQTLGSPIALVVRNRDWENWQKIMSPDPGAITDRGTVTRPRPGHADLPGGIKYRHKDLRNVLERASARETAARVAVGGIAKQVLAPFGIGIHSCVIQLGPVRASEESILQSFDSSYDDGPLRCPDPDAEARMIDAVDQAKANGDTLGGIVQVVATGLPVGLGTYVEWDARLDTRLAGAMMGIPAIKGVEIGPAFENAGLSGSRVHDEIFYDADASGFYRKQNRAGGLEGGITNGEPLMVRIAMKPLSTLMQALQSVDIHTKESFGASRQRTDTCAVPAAGVVAEAMMAIVLAQAIGEKFGGDSLEETLTYYRAYMEYVRGV